MVGLVPTIQPSGGTGARGELDPRDKPEDDNGEYGVRNRRVKHSGFIDGVLLTVTAGSCEPTPEPAPAMSSLWSAGMVFACASATTG
jgi:hypothetical protein